MLSFSLQVEALDDDYDYSIEDFGQFIPLSLSLSLSLSLCPSLYTRGCFAKTGTIGTLASQSEIGVCLGPSTGGITPDIF